MAAIKQHALVKKRAGEGMFFLSCSPYSCLGLYLRHIVMTHMYREMQSKLSNTRVLPLGSMG